MISPKRVNKIKNFLKELFFPSFCLGCQKEGAYLCEDCKEVLDISKFQYCLCGKNPLIINSSPSDQTKLWCGDKQKSASWRNGKCKKCFSKNLSGLYFALPYKEKPLTKKLIRQFKYEPYTKDLAKTLALLLVEHFLLTGKNKEEIWRNSILIPVPLDKNKLKSRGYNQAEELSKELSKILQTPVITNVLFKTKSTKPQMELSKEQREKNIKGVFAIKIPQNLVMSDIAKFWGKKVFLVDDVYTTGSTMEECAKVLKQAGAKQVWGITLAREE